MKLNIAVIHGTSRPNSRSSMPAKYLADYFSNIEDVEVKLVHPSDFEVKPDGNDPEVKIPAYAEIVDWADGFIVVTPEYNHSFPGSLKQLMDKEYNLYKNKAVGIVGVSDGGWGGTRVIEALKPVLVEYGLVISQKAMNFPRVQDLFDEAGKPVNQAELDERAKPFADNVLWLAKAMKWGRENLG